jgi:hypothetical protein
MKKLDEVNWNDWDEILEIWGTLSTEERKNARVKMQKAGIEMWKSLPEGEKAYWSAAPSHPHELGQIFVGCHSEPFMEFEGRLSSLQRFHHHGQRFLQEYFAESQDFNESLEDDVPGESVERASEILMWDKQYFEEYLHGATLAHLFALTETLLSDVVEEYKTPENEAALTAINERKLPYINRYILFLQRGCGLDVKLDSTIWKQIDTLRGARNKFVHELMVDFPAEIQDRLQEIFTEVEVTGLSKEIVDMAFETVCDIAMILQSACHRDFTAQERGKRNE